jgi:hypothetical protein
MDNHAKRLLLFAPDTSFWHTICRGWDNVALFPMGESTRWEDVVYQVMLDRILCFL